MFYTSFFIYLVGNAFYLNLFFLFIFVLLLTQLPSQFSIVREKNILRKEIISLSDQKNQTENKCSKIALECNTLREGKVFFLCILFALNSFYFEILYIILSQTYACYIITIFHSSLSTNFPTYLLTN